MDNQMNEERLVELETRLAYQDQLVEALNKLVFEQDKRVQKLELTCKNLGKQLLDLAEDSAIAESDEPPPHY
jgi:SlyX protein